MKTQIVRTVTAAVLTTVGLCLAPGAARAQLAEVSRAGAVDMVFDVFVDVCPHIIPVPALNKWLSVLPAVADIARGAAPHS